MTLFTRSKFYYGHTVTRENRNIDFQEGSTLFTATLRPRGYSLQGFAAEVRRAMNIVSDNEYLVLVNRETRQITIQGNDNFSLLPVTGTNAGTSALPLAGFESDLSGDNSYTGETSGFEFTPLLPLQDYIPFENEKEFIDTVINESASGRIETVTYGIREFMSCNIRYQGNKPIAGRVDLNGRQDLLQFMRYIVTKAEIEFMENKDAPQFFSTCLLERSQSSGDGTGFRLTESDRLPGYLETGRLVFRRRV